MNWFLNPQEARSVQVRYNGSPVPCVVEEGEGGEWVARLADPVVGWRRASRPSSTRGDGERVVGGGVVAHRVA
jgi:hypothetical protein